MPTEPSWLTVLLLLVSGFVLLAKGADWLVTGSSGIARRFGVSVLAIGLTVVAWGTSAPEVVTSAMAAYEGQSALSLGNVLGSNVANIGLVLGTCSVVLPAVMQSKLGRRDLVWLFASLAALWVVASDHAISRTDAGLLLGAFLIYNGILFVTSRGEQPPEAAAADAGPRAWFLTAAGMVGVALGAWLVVQGATRGASMLGVDQRVVGLTVVALGTSLPELAAGLGGALKGEADISLGNVVGSNIFNVLAVLGIVGLVRPLEASAMPDDAARAELEAAFEGSLSVDLPIVLGFSLAATVLPYLGGPRSGRLKGLILLGAYGAYTARLYGL